MVTFTFSGTLPQTKGLISSSQLRSRFNDIDTFLDTVNALGLTIPTSVASAAQYDILLLNSGKTGFDFGKTIRSTTSISFSGTPTSGQFLQFDSATTAVPVSTSLPNQWENKTTGFTTADGGRYQVNGGITIALATPTDVDYEFWIKPAIGQDLAASPLVFSGAMTVAGVAAASYVGDENVIYHFTSNATNYDVSAEVLDR